MLSRFILTLLALLALALPATAQSTGLDLYFIDTEGGQATLIVTPAGESLLIDSGNPGTRDAKRIYEVATGAAKLKQIDHLIVTHWHLDHYGGHGELAKMIPCLNFYDHGIPEKSIDDPDNFPKLIAAYKEASKGKSVTLKAGDRVPLKRADGSPNIQLRTLVGMQEVVPARNNARPNPLAGETTEKPKDTSDNANSLGFVLRYGNWRFLNLGDLTWNIENKLIAPENRIGSIDLYLTTHHGLEVSNNPVLIKSVAPRVAIFNNGPRKGGHPDVTKALKSVPGLEAIWQLHRNVTVGAEDNTAPERIANMEENCKAEFIKVSVAADSKSYTVQIGKDGKPTTYQTKNQRELRQ
jgi:beta-lactamase superfamily II metal-dependent hydrolase